MKRNLLWRLLALVCLLLPLGLRAQQTKAPVSPVSKAITTSAAKFKPEFDAYGLLTGVKNAQGQIVSAQGATTFYDGYLVAYQVGGTASKTKAVRWVAATPQQTTQKELLPAAKREGNSIVVTTADGALEITTVWLESEQPGKVLLSRRIKNVSAKPVSLLAVEAQTDARLSTSQTPTNAGAARQGKSLRMDAVLYIKPLDHHDDMCDPCQMKCPELPPCRSTDSIEITAVPHCFAESQRLQIPTNRQCLICRECLKLKDQMRAYWEVGRNLTPTPLAPGESAIVNIGLYLN